jgi:hypothetical protein
VAAGVLTAGTILCPAAAFATPSDRAATIAPLDASSPSDIAETGTMPGTNLPCTAFFRWQVHQASATSDAFSQVEWTANACGFRIQDRSLCDKAGTLTWVTSGEVVRTFLWDRATCPDGAAIVEAQVHVYDGGGWSPYVTYWTV